MDRDLKLVLGTVAACGAAAAIYNRASGIVAVASAPLSAPTAAPSSGKSNAYACTVDMVTDAKNLPDSSPPGSVTLAYWDIRGLAQVG